MRHILLLGFFSLSLIAQNSWLGVNLEGLADWSSASVFSDAMRTSRSWGKPRQPWVHEVKTDEYGWPLEDAGVIVMVDRPNISGDYKLAFDGPAQVEILHRQGEILDLQIDGKGHGTAIVRLKPDANQLMLSFTKTQGGVRNVTLIRPGCDPAKRFTNEFLAVLEPFGILRFMDFMATNSQNTFPKPPWYDATPLEWKDRAKVANASQTGKRGAAYEFVAELANETKKDAWICVPIHASHDYIRKMAELFRDRLDPKLNLYVELSNEVWNWGFAAAQYNLHHIAKNTPKYHGSYIICHADRTRQMADIFADVFGRDTLNKRVRIVLCWQFGWNPPDAQPREMFQFYKQEGHDPAKWLYALGIAPYFSEPKPEDCTSVAAIHDHFRKSSDASVANKRKLIALAKEFGLQGGVVCYEGGPHHQGQVEANLETRFAAHRDPGIEAIIKHDLLDNWRVLGGGAYCYFSLSGRYSKWGCWGAVESLNNLNTPKYKALLEVAKTK